MQYSPYCQQNASVLLNCTVIPEQHFCEFCKDFLYIEDLLLCVDYSWHVILLIADEQQPSYVSKGGEVLGRVDLLKYEIHTIIVK